MFVGPQGPLRRVGQIKRTGTAQVKLGLGEDQVKAFFELLAKAMQSNGMTLRLCLLMLVAAAAYVISQR